MGILIDGEGYIERGKDVKSIMAVHPLEPVSQILFPGEEIRIKLSPDTDQDVRVIYDKEGNVRCLGHGEIVMTSDDHTLYINNVLVNGRPVEVSGTGEGAGHLEIRRMEEAA